MRVLIATTGALSPGAVVDFAARLVGDDGEATVITVIEVPRSFLVAIRSEHWHPLESDQPAPSWSTSDEDAVIARYVEERGRKLTEPVLAALLSAGIEAAAHYLEGEDPVRTILDAADEHDADAIVLGATRKIFDESAWESVSARVMIESGRPVLVVPPKREITPVPDDVD